jgi:hypothetical protein
MGYAVQDIPYIGLAEKMGVGSADLRAAKVRELNRCQPATGEAGGGPSGKVRALAPRILENEACSACYAALVSALSRLGPNELSRIREKVSVGQGFRGKKGGRGAGQCCSSFSAFCPGCPPSGADILAFLRRRI